jgi:DNA-binding NarL/FixJ family response regulator
MPHLGIQGRIMPCAFTLPILEAAYDLSSTSHEALKNIARAAAGATPRGTVVAAWFGTDAQLDLRMLHFERARPRYVRGILEWQRVTSVGFRHRLLSLTPRVIRCCAEEYDPLPAEARGLARELFPLCAMGNTGDGGGLHVAFSDPELGVWPSARIRPFNAIAQHLAVAWRIRTSLHTAHAPAIAGELRVNGTAVHLGPDSSAPTAREALRRAVIARERARSRRRSAGDRELWPALVAGRWSLLDAFTASGTRYIVAYENPAEATELRALLPHEHAVVEYALEGRSGKWIALEMELSESVVARALRTALRRLGVTGIAALASARTALFETVEDMVAVDSLAMARVTPGQRPMAHLSGAERDIATCLLSGMRPPVIARERGTSPRTVSHQIASIYHKLGVSSHRELLAQLA